jgi:hypothetical protein
MSTAMKWMLALALVGLSASAVSQETFDVNNLQIGTDYLTGSFSIPSTAAVGSGIPNASLFSNVSLDLYSRNSDSAGSLVDTFTSGQCAYGPCLSLQAGGNLVATDNGNVAPILAFLDASNDIGVNISLDQVLIACGVPNAACGLQTPIPSGTSLVFATLSPATQAPEIDTACAASGFALLLGELIVLRGRRSVKLDSGAVYSRGASIAAASDTSLTG